MTLSKLDYRTGRKKLSTCTLQPSNEFLVNTTGSLQVERKIR